MSRFISRTLADHLRQSGGLPDLERVNDREVISRCRAAAHSVTRNWADAEDTAAEVILELVSSAGHPKQRGTAAEVIRWIDQVERGYCPPIERRQLRAGVLKLRCRRMLARKLTAHAARIENPDTSTGTLADTLDTLPEIKQDRPLALPPAAAEVAARKLAALLKLPCIGGVDVALYSILRDVREGEAPQLAAELGMTYAAYRMAFTRGRKTICATYPDPDDLLAALLLLDPPAREARKRTRMLAQDARTENGLTYPTTAHRVTTVKIGRDHWRGTWTPRDRRAVETAAA